MPLKFGTSGLRGLVTDMTPEAVAQYTRAFLAASADQSGGPVPLCVGRDLRPSSPRIAGDVIAAARAAGHRVIDCGAVPTPALALAAQARGAAAVMVTGSHIPADRNGLKFYTPLGEITKSDEAAILAQMTAPGAPDGTPGPLEADTDVGVRFTQRFVTAYGAGALAGRRIGLYAHSAVGRDILSDILSALGAEVIEVGRSQVFIPVDTEAVDAATRARISDWVRAHHLNALVSMDGDSDRPLLADEAGHIVPGDILGQITAQALGAQVVVTPISSNSGVTLKGFEQVVTTSIGSPFVIAGMQGAICAGRDAVVGYEANGGFLLGFEAQGPAGPLAPLMTRDCVLPLLAVLHAAGIRAGTGAVSARVAGEPPVVTLSDRLQEVAQDKSRPLIESLAGDARARAAFLAPLGVLEAAVDLTDGVRMTLEGGAVVHVRPSGNAPELRLYVEARSAKQAQALMTSALAHLRRVVSGTPEG